MANTIHYEKELNFFFKALEYNSLTYHKEFINNISTDMIDFGIRKKMGLSSDFTHFKKAFSLESNPHRLIYITDEFFCRYILFALPDTSPEELVIIGPYLISNETEKISSFFSENNISPEWLTILNNYYVNVPHLTNEESVNALLYSLADTLWGNENYTIANYVNNIEDSVLVLANSPDAKQRLDSISNIDIIEALYSQENALMHAISHGQLSRAKNILTNLPLLNFKSQMEAIQNLKVFSVVLNTLFRKAAEQGGVHPIYIDQLSNAIIQRIANFTRSDNILDMWNDMIQKYCSLVNNYSTQEYSLPIQKVIIQINLDLSADLSLKTLAEYLNVNASYLSTLFHKETGVTLSNYVNHKRMDYAAWLLSSTPLPISTIAQHCGILDDNYFTKLFKKQYGITPTAFRDSAGKHYLTK